MLFQAPESSLKLDIVNYEFPADGGAYASDDRNWLVLRCTWMKEDGDIRKDSNSCLLTYELREMTAGLKVVRAGIKDATRATLWSPTLPCLSGRKERMLSGPGSASFCQTPWTGRTPPRWSVSSPGSSYRIWWRSWTSSVGNFRSGPERRHMKEKAGPVWVPLFGAEAEKYAATA